MFNHTANKYNEAPLKIILINSKLLSFRPGWLSIFCTLETKSRTEGLCLGDSAPAGSSSPPLCHPWTAQNKIPNKTGNSAKLTQ